MIRNVSGAFHKRTIRDIDLDGRRVLLRVDYNVQVMDDVVFDDLRLRESLPTLTYLREHGARIVICSHRGRPRGQVVEELRNAPVAAHLSRLLGAPVGCVQECVGADVEAATRELAPGELLMLENVRFHPEEEANDQAFARQLAALGDIYVSDAFGTAHRAPWPG
jgi:phosphoglycerate kinase